MESENHGQDERGQRAETPPQNPQAIKVTLTLDEALGAAKASLDELKAGLKRSGQRSSR